MTARMKLVAGDPHLAVLDRVRQVRSLLVKFGDRPTATSCHQRSLLLGGIDGPAGVFLGSSASRVGHRGVLLLRADGRQRPVVVRVGM